MGDEEKQDQETEAQGQEAETEAQGQEAEGATAEQPEAERDSSAEASAEPAEASAEPAGATAAVAAAAEEVEALSPKEARKRARSLASGPPSPPRSPAERAAERAEHRRTRAAVRRRRRQATRAKAREGGEGTPPAEHLAGNRKVRQGTVISSKPDKTITVQIEVARRHPVYEKVVRRSATLRAHDERNEANEGDIVRVVESRPLSKTKRWRLVEILERAR